MTCVFRPEIQKIESVLTRVLRHAPDLMYHCIRTYVGIMQDCKVSMENYTKEHQHKQRPKIEGADFERYSEEDISRTKTSFEVNVNYLHINFFFLNKSTIVHLSFDYCFYRFHSF